MVSACSNERLVTCVKIEREGKENGYVEAKTGLFGTFHKPQYINDIICFGGNYPEWCYTRLQLTIFPNDGYTAFLNGSHFKDYKYIISNSDENQIIDVSFKPTTAALCPDTINYIDIEIIGEKYGRIEHSGKIDADGRIYLSDVCQWLEINIIPNKDCAVYVNGYAYYPKYDGKYYMKENEQKNQRGDKIKNRGLEILFLPPNSDCTNDRGCGFTGNPD